MGAIKFLVLAVIGYFGYEYLTSGASGVSSSGTVSGVVPSGSLTQANANYQIFYITDGVQANMQTIAQNQFGYQSGTLDAGVWNQIYNLASGTTNLPNAANFAQLGQLTLGEYISFVNSFLKGQVLTAQLGLSGLRRTYV